MKLNSHFNKFINDIQVNGQKIAIIENNISYSYENLYTKIMFYIDELESKKI